MPTIKINGKTISYTVKSVTTSEVTFSDGKKATVTGSVANAAILKAYKGLIAQEPPVVTPPVVEPPVVIIPPSPGQGKEISWSDFAKLSDVENQSFIIKPGSYTTEANPRNLKNVTIEGNNKFNLSTGYRGITLSGKMIGVVLSGFNLTGIPNYQIVIDQADKNKYNGKEGSFVDGLTLKNFVVNGGGTLLQCEGNIRNGIYDGVVRNFKLLNSTLKDMANPGSVIYLGNGFDYEITGNTFNNINRGFVSSKDVPNGIHNGILMLKGNGKVYGNKITNHQGNFARMWVHSLDGKGLTEVNANTVYNSIKYSAFELQTPQDMVSNGAKVSNAKVSNNIAGQLSTSKDWDGQMLDLYNINGGALEYTGNKGFDMISSNPQWKPVSNMINNMSDVKITERDNVYFKTLSEAQKAIPNLAL